MGSVDAMQQATSPRSRAAVPRTPSPRGRSCRSPAPRTPSPRAPRTPPRPGQKSWGLGSPPPHPVKSRRRPTLPKGVEARDIWETFEFGRRIGKGVHGGVYLCKATSKLNRPQCLKILEEETAHDCAQEVSMLQNAQGHPNVCALYEVAYCADSHLPVMALELLTGLSDCLRPSDLVAMAEDMLKALAHVWTKCCMVHNDVKPSNTMQRRNPEGDLYVLVDFGRAFEVRNLFSASYSTGDATYLAPDRHATCKSFEDAHKIDVYALGLSVAEKGIQAHPASLCRSTIFSVNEARGAVLARLNELPVSLQGLVEAALNPLNSRPTAMKISADLSVSSMGA